MKAAVLYGKGDLFLCANPSAQEEALEIMADKQLLKEIKEAKEDIKAGRYKTYEDYFNSKVPKEF